MSKNSLNLGRIAEGFSAWLFDLDGVLTATSKVHATCWKKMFDEYLEQYAAKHHKTMQPFNIDRDYTIYLDGKARYDGVRDFLQSRGVHIPPGTPNDSLETETLYGLGNRKDLFVHAVIDSDGVEAYDGSVALVRFLREKGIKTAVVSSSHHCEEILRSAEIADLFEVRVDGKTIDELKLSGKPAPDAFLHAAQQLGVDPSAAVVIEDALSGVQAGKQGNFGLVVGVARHGNNEELKKYGADFVVTDLGEFLPDHRIDVST